MTETAIDPYGKSNMGTPRCRRCGGRMKRGIALEQTYTGSPDFPGGEVVTMSPGGPGRLVECMKCEKCGWSVR